jgi:hypothetical protein
MKDIIQKWRALRERIGSDGAGGRALIAACLFLACCPSAFGEDALADSDLQFSSHQGRDGWYYGFYDGDGSTPYSTGDFELLDYWSGTTWRMGPSGDDYWCMLYGDGGHPVVGHWPVRRWVSDYDGVVTITGVLKDRAASTLWDGIVGGIIIDDELVMQTAISEGDLVGVNYLVEAPVSVGSTVDFFIAPQGNNRHDHTIFTAVIVPEPATLSLLAIGGVALMRSRRR